MVVVADGRTDSCDVAAGCSEDVRTSDVELGTRAVAVLVVEISDPAGFVVL